MALKVGAAQLGPASDDKEQNADTVRRLIRNAADLGVRIVAFPELSLTKYFCTQNTREYEHFFDTTDSPHLASVRATAAETGVAVVLPYAERSEVAFYNSAIVVDRLGHLVGRYRKMHIPGSFPEGSGAVTFERFFFTPGDLGFPVFEVEGLRIGIQICHDRNFPEGFRILALRGAALIFVPTNMPAWGMTWTPAVWELMLRARAHENGTFIVGVAKSGVEDGLRFVGESMIFSPLGPRLIGRAQSEGEEVVLAEVDLDEVTEARRRLPWMRDRRPEHYGPIAR